jgi:two-component system OmpR family response regulator
MPTVKKNILVIEDDPDIGRLIESSLESGNYIITVTDSGADGLVMLQSINYDLLILDLNLPGIDGIEICRKVRKFNDALPIFIVSGRDTEIDRVIGRELGADEYITKPFSARELKARVNAFFRRLEKSGRE